MPDQLVDIFSPLSCYNGDLIEMAQFNLTGESESYSEVKLLAQVRSEIMLSSGIKSETRITNIHLVKSDQLVIRFMLLPSLTDSSDQMIYISTDLALSNLNETLNSKSFDVMVEGVEFSGVERSLLTSDDGVNFQPSTTNPIVKNVTITQERLSSGTFYAVIFVVALGTILITGIALTMYNRNNVSSSGGLEMQIM